MKPTIITLIFVVFAHALSAQVGIGTTNPDASAILDLNSTTQGVLAPRMSTIQRTTIATPAEGLLVYDTDANAFYYYSSGSWVALESAIKRDNYKLIKSVADLSDELVAGGGTEYLLSSNFLYEINGSITMDFPINLNNAYVKGEDNLEDRLVNNTGAALFTGSSGGNLKRMTIIGNGNPIFDLTGTGSENLVSLAVNYIGSSSVGTLKNLGLVFFNTGQFISNSTGLTITDINSYFMTLFTWTDTNSGTFLSINGTLDELQLSNARIFADTGETGIDVSSNPTITASASLAQVSFNGLGTRVNPYTVGSYLDYNFNTDWYIESQGIPKETDGNAIGDINLNYPIGTGALTAFTGTGATSRTKLAGNTISNNLFRFASVGNNRITYEGKDTRYFSVNGSISFQGSNNNAIFVFYIAKNGTVVEQTRVYREIGTNNDVGAVAVVGEIELDPGDYIEVWAERFSGSGNLLTVSLNLIAR